MSSSSFKFIAKASLFLLVAISSITGCQKGDDNNIPNVPVDIYIPLALPDYVALNSIGNHVIISGGYKGIIIFRKSIDQFAAYERACPFDPTTSGSIVEPDSSLVLGIDYKCGSKFNFFDGSIVNGPATRPLRQYNCDYDAATMSLRIYN